MTRNEPKTPSEAPLEPYNGTLSTISGNSLMAISPVIHIKTQVLGLVLGLDNELYRLVECESGFDSEARGKAGEIGLFQYMPSTWKWFNHLRGSNLDIYNPEHQLKMTQWAWENKLQKHWSCWKIINSSF